jgi:hypothetical protein
LEESGGLETNRAGSRKFQVLVTMPGDFGGSIRLTTFPALEARAQVSLMEIKDAAVADLDNFSSSASGVILSMNSWSSSCWNRVTLRRSCDRS